MAKVYIETNGCAHNYSDSEHMAGLLAKQGHTLVKTEKEADLVLFNTCTVKTPTEHSFFNRLKEVSNRDKKVVVAGCIPQTDSEKFKGISIIGTHQVDKIGEVVDATLNGQSPQLIQRGRQPELLIPRIRSNPIVEIITINSGCLGSCTFCKTKAARGNLASYSIEEVVKKARQATVEGAREIWLTSQDTACYGFDKKTNVANLLTELCKIGKDFKIRLGMGNPDHFIKITEEAIRAMKDEKVYKFLHIPIQAGSDEVLENMKRGYKVKDYLKIIKAFKSAFPQITIATDVICGFPGETEAQFGETVELIKSTQPDIVNVSRYWARGKTLAARKKSQIPSEEIMRRSEKLSRIAREISLNNNKKWIGWEGEILINEKGDKKNQWKGRNESYKSVLIEGDYMIGQKVNVNIEKATVNDLIARVSH